MKLSILASGSSGNCIVVTSGTGRSIMIDAGINLKAIRARMDEAGCDPASVEALLITHEHSDHCAHVPTLIKAYPGLRCFATEGTAGGVEQYIAKTNRSAKSPAQILWDIFEAGQSFEAAGMTVESFPVSHDCADPVGYAVTDGECRIVVATDMGVAPEATVRRIRGCDALVLESNHDPDMLRDSGRPWSLKQRIAGRQGHLSNDQAAEVLRAVADSRLKAVYLAHISAECNSTRLAEKIAGATLRSIGRGDVSLRIALRSEPSEIFEL